METPQLHQTVSSLSTAATLLIVVPLTMASRGPLRVSRSLLSVFKPVGAPNRVVVTIASVLCLY